MKNAFDGLISRLRKEPLSLSTCQQILSKTEKQRKKDGAEYQRTAGQLQRCNICVMGIHIFLRNND